MKSKGQTSFIRFIAHVKPFDGRQHDTSVEQPLWLVM